ncbi:TWiK family of potassium channels protein 9, partial [Trichinella sp. T8]
LYFKKRCILKNNFLYKQITMGVNIDGALKKQKLFEMLSPIAFVDNNSIDCFTIFLDYPLSTSPDLVFIFMIGHFVLAKPAPLKRSTTNCQLKPEDGNFSDSETDGSQLTIQLSADLTLFISCVNRKPGAHHTGPFADTALQPDNEHPPLLNQHAQLCRFDAALDSQCGEIFSATFATVSGGYDVHVFYMIEKPEEHAWKLEGKEKIFREANKLMMYLVTLKSTDLSSMIAEDNLQPLEHRIATVLSKTYELAKMHYLDPEDLLDPHSTPEGRRWTFASSFLFSFTLITTIGYGNLTPVTMNGRVFCIIYGLFGIPLVMITIANTGRFMFDGMVAILEVLRRAFACLVGRIRRTDKNSSRRRSIVEMISHSHPESGTSVGSPGVVLAFFSHIFLGAMILPQWEDMDFFSAFYFSFVTITTVGFGDIVPRKYEYLPLTLAYVTVGLALATLMVQVMGHYLRKLHYIGRKIMNASGAFVWFGNKMLTVNDLVAVIGRKYGMSIAQIAHLQADLDTVIIETVKEKSELVKKKRGVASSTATATLLPNGQYFDRQFRYIDAEGPSTPSLVTDRVIFEPPPSVFISMDDVASQ